MLGCWLTVAAAPAAPAAVEPLPDLPLPELSPAPVEQLTQTVAPGPGPERRMVTEVNRTRRARGLRPLRASRSLRRSAHRYAAWMLRAAYFGHLARIRASRNYRRVGEALALHSGRRSQIRMTVERWLRSPPHRALLLSHRFRYLGAGRRSGRFRGRAATTWVLHLGG